MDPDKQAVVKTALRDIAVNAVKLGGALCVLAYCLGGQSTRAWMTAFAFGTLSGLTDQPTLSRASLSTSNTPPLRLLGHGCRKEAPYLICEGEVRNETDLRLESVMAEVKFTDRDGTFVTSESAMINYQPLMPGQTSPFKVIAMWNPQIWHFSFGFREMFGGALKAAR